MSNLGDLPLTPTHHRPSSIVLFYQYYDKLLRDISVNIFSCTERQAVNLGEKKEDNNNTYY